LPERKHIVTDVTKHLRVVAIALTLLALCGAWSTAAAQPPKPGAQAPPPSQDRVLDKVSFGYKYYRVSYSEVGYGYPLGFYVDASGDLRALAGWDWIGEVTYARRSETDEDIFGSVDITENVIFFGGGLKREFTTNPQFIPHCQGLVGFARFGFSVSGDVLGFDVDDSGSESAFALKGSCAVDYVFTPKWDIRGGAGIIRAFTEDEGTTIFRLFFGLVWKME
jgi:hypothetical protein